MVLVVLQAEAEGADLPDPDGLQERMRTILTSALPGSGNVHGGALSALIGPIGIP